MIWIGEAEGMGEKTRGCTQSVHVVAGPRVVYMVQQLEGAAAFFNLGPEEVISKSPIVKRGGKEFKSVVVALGKGEFSTEGEALRHGDMRSANTILRHIQVKPISRPSRCRMRIAGRRLSKGPVRVVR